MSKPMIIAVARDGVSVLYRCYKLPGYGRKCPDKYSPRCYKCKFCKAEMSAADATKLLGRKHDSNSERYEDAEKL